MTGMKMCHSNEVGQLVEQLHGFAEACGAAAPPDPKALLSDLASAILPVLDRMEEGTTTAGDARTVATALALLVEKSYLKGRPA